MTIDQVIEIVKESTPYPVVAETQLKGLGMDSLEFLELMVRLSIPDAQVPYVNTVTDLHAAASGAVYEPTDGLWHKKADWNPATETPHSDNFTS